MAWNLFRRKPLLSEDDACFQIECYKWLLTHFGGDDFYRDTELVLPTKEFFPFHADSPEDLAQLTFARVKKFAGLQDWPCILQSQEKDPDVRIAPTLHIKDAAHNPLGTFSANQSDPITITYNPRIVANPTQMIATFAHELSHYLTATAPEPPPGGWENWEFATDIGATFLGFGIFQGNGAFNFQQYTSFDSQGWQVSRNGYLTEEEHSYALALFILLKENSPKTAYPHCSPNIKSFLVKALKELQDSSIIKELRQVEFVRSG